MKRASFFLSLIIVAVAAGCGEKPVAVVEISHSITPKEPLSEQFMHIAVYNAETAGSDEYDQKKWEDMAANLIQGSLQRSADDHDIPIQLVDREHVKVALAEGDMKDAGITEGGGSTSALSEATAIITSKVNVKVDTQKSTKTKINPAAMLQFAGVGGGGMTKEVEEEIRSITVQCQFQLKANDGSNRIIASYAGPWAQHSEGGSSNPFGGGSDEGDMAPRDQVIGAIVDKEICRFVCKFVPTEIRATCRVEASSSDASVAGVKALVADDYETALLSFENAVAKKSTDEKSLFGAGVAAEKLGQFDKALRYYKQAHSYEDEEPQYAEAVQRVQSLI